MLLWYPSCAGRRWIGASQHQWDQVAMVWHRPAPFGGSCRHGGAHLSAGNNDCNHKDLIESRDVIFCAGTSWPNMTC